MPVSCVIQTRKPGEAGALITTLLTPQLAKSLYERHGAALVTFARCYGLDFASAEDVVKQVFLRLLRRQTSTPQMPAAYLYRAVRNAALNHRRDRHRETRLSGDETWFVAPNADPVEVLALQNALQELSEDQRETLYLRIWSGMTLQEVAEATETPLNTVASRYRYALEKLRERLGEKLGKAGIGYVER
jgi:RNA polymerase sigma-70 factor, ECF subfamily